MNVCRCHDRVTVVLKYDMVCKHEETAQLREEHVTHGRENTADVYQPLKTLFKFNFNQT